MIMKAFVFVFSILFVLCLGCSTVESVDVVAYSDSSLSEIYELSAAELAEITLILSQEESAVLSDDWTPYPAFFLKVNGEGVYGVYSDRIIMLDPEGDHVVGSCWWRTKK